MTNVRAGRLFADGAYTDECRWVPAADFERLDADAAGLQAELASVKACWAEALGNYTDMTTQRDHWLQIAQEKDKEIERLTIQRDSYLSQAEGKGQCIQRLQRELRNQGYTQPQVIWVSEGRGPIGAPTSHEPNEQHCAEGKAAPAGDASDSGRVADRHTNAGATPVPRFPRGAQAAVPGGSGCAGLNVQFVEAGGVTAPKPRPCPTGKHWLIDKQTCDCCAEKSGEQVCKIHNEKLSADGECSQCIEGLSSALRET